MHVCVRILAGVAQIDMGRLLRRRTGMADRSTARPASGASGTARYFVASDKSSLSSADTCSFTALIAAQFL